jgi:hypothetical protein
MVLHFRFSMVPPLAEQNVAGVGAVNGYVTHRTSLTLCVLWVRRVIEVLVTLQAHGVHA